MGALLVALFSFVYWYTLAPTVLWGDSAKLCLYVHDMYLAADPIGNHMLHTLFGKLFSFLPVGDFAYRQNLMSAFFGVLTLWVFYRMMRQMVDAPSAFLSALSLGISHTFWLVSVVNESYALLMFFFVLGFFLLLRWEKSGRNSYLYLHSFLIGAGLLSNMLEGMMVPATVLFLAASEKGRAWLFSRRFLWGVGCFFFSLFPMALLVLVQGPISIGGVGWFLRPGEIFPEIFFYPFYLFYQFPLFGVWLGLMGLQQMFREKRDFLWVLSAVLFLDVLFASGYMRQRRFFLFLPSYFCFSVWIGFGTARVRTAWHRRTEVRTAALAALLVCMPIGLYLSVPFVAEKYHLDLVRGRKLALRDNNRFYLNPVKRNETGARDYGRKALEVTRPGSIIIGDFTPAMVLLYYQKTEGLRPDVEVTIFIDSYVRSPERRRELYAFIGAELQRRPLYIADNEESYYGIKELKKQFDLIPQGPLWEIRHRES